MKPNEPIWSVSAINKAVKDTLENVFMPFWMGGEVGSLILHRSGHAYFQMKDEQSQIKVCWFGGADECRKLGVDNGSMVEVRGNLSVYTVRGEYQFNVKELRIAGLGTLQQQFELIKRKLQAEGLFDRSRKKPLPLRPQTIGVVSSPSGAAVKDFLQILYRRFHNIEVKIFPARVQGTGAVKDLCDGIKFFNRTGQADVIVVTRGGGSMEDLWCFNDETLARTIAASKIPVISAVGHEIDFTICDFAADLRVPTPSAAAELVVGSQEDLSNRVERAFKEVCFFTERRFLELDSRLTGLAGKIEYYEPHKVAERLSQRIDELELRAQNAWQLSNTEAERKLDNLDARLYALSPERQLERGYAIIYSGDGSQIITSSQQTPGTELQIRFADGKLQVVSR